MKKLKLFTAQNEIKHKSIAKLKSPNLEDIVFDWRDESLIITVKREDNTITETILRYDIESGTFYNIDK